VEPVQISTTANRQRVALYGHVLTGLHARLFNAADRSIAHSLLNSSLGYKLADWSGKFMHSLVES